MPSRDNILSRRAFQWLKSPAAAGMGAMARRLHRSTNNPRLHTSLLREVLLAKKLTEVGFDVGSEVPTPAGKSCDLVATRGSLVLHLHVKCMKTDDAPPRPRSARIPAALRALENIDRRLLIEVEWQSGLSAAALRMTADAMRSFLVRAAIGDECVVRSRRGTLRGRCRIRSSRDAGGVTLTSGIDDDHPLAVTRVLRLLRKARGQFLSGGENIIVIFGPRIAKWTFTHALLGTPIERWDEYPRRGERVALGHADDGFWRHCGDDLSRIVAWQSLDATGDDSAAWMRIGVAAATRGACAEIFQHIVPARR